MHRIVFILGNFEGRCRRTAGRTDMASTTRPSLKLFQTVKTEIMNSNRMARKKGICT